MVTATDFILLRKLRKGTAILVYMLCCVTVSIAQQAVQPMGITRLSIARLNTPQPLSVTSLGIPSNQTIAPNAVCACANGCSVLPLELLKFEGRRLNEDEVMLHWETTNEYNNKGFEVQRSLGNEQTFTPITFVPAKTGVTSSFTYDLPDNNSFMGISYYRLKQLDLDGRYTFSNIVAIKGYGKQASLHIYPNPVTTQLHAEIYALQKTKATLLITDAMQRTLLIKSIVLNKGMNQFTLSATHLSGGVYLIRVIPELGNTLGGKFVKM